MTRIDKGYRFEGIVSEIDEALCAGCGTCVEACPYNAIDLVEATGKAKVNAALCKGCGVCAAACRMGPPSRRTSRTSR